MDSQVERDAKIVGTAVAEVLPRSDKYWFQQPHLLRLNLLLLIPLLSSSVSGYDGLFFVPKLEPGSRSPLRLPDERSPISTSMAQIL